MGDIFTPKIVAEAGRFTINELDVLNGPKEYMEQQGNALVDKILAGEDQIFDMTSHLSPTIQLAICVRLQTDFAGWLGMQQFTKQMGVQDG